MSELLEGVVKIAKKAGAAILDVYGGEDFGVETKADNSPLTKADLAAHEIIISGLSELAPGVPILSEESEQVPYAIRKKWQRYFLVDPLDGTKEFIHRNGEFTVNVALIEEGIPVLGVVFVPVSGVIYAGQQLDTRIAFVDRAGSRIDIVTRNLPRRLRNGEALVVVASRRHGGQALQRCVDVLTEKFTDIALTTMCITLTFCLVA